MTIAWPKVIPVLISIAIIILVAILSDSLPMVAAITATAPMTFPLSMWVVYASTGNDREVLASYTQSMMVGLGATLGFAIGVWIATRYRLGLWVTLGIGYTAWGVTLAIIFGLRRVIGF
ncbi:MAG: hypothetical protein JXJ17_00130 [Anaerolineae bacterium]|nr:hypothetical protein [Anaerolineae bacterium]